MNLYDHLFSLDISLNELRILSLIIRMSIGCLDKKTADLIQRDFVIYKVSEVTVKEVIDKLLNKNLIYRIGNSFSINQEEILNTQLHPRLNKTLSKNLTNNGYRYIEHLYIQKFYFFLHHSSTYVYLRNLKTRY